MPDPTPPGKKPLVVSTPADLHAWALAQARREGTDLSKKVNLFLRDWQAAVRAAEAEAKARAEQRRQADIQAAVAAALRAKGRAGAKAKSQARAKKAKA